MATFDYAKSATTADRLITKFGQSATLETTEKTGDDWDPIITTTETACKVAVLGYSDSVMDGTRIKTGDKKVYLSTSGLGSVVPSTAAKITIGGTEHQIVNVKPLNPGGSVVFYELQCRL